MLSLQFLAMFCLQIRNMIFTQVSIALKLLVFIIQPGDKFQILPYFLHLKSLH